MEGNIPIVTQDEMLTMVEDDNKKDGGILEEVPSPSSKQDNKEKVQLNLFGEEAKVQTKIIQVKGYKKKNGMFIAPYNRVISVRSPKKASSPNGEKLKKKKDPKYGKSVSLAKSLEIQQKLNLIRNFNKF